MMHELSETLLVFCHSLPLWLEVICFVILLQKLCAALFMYYVFLCKF